MSYFSVDILTPDSVVGRDLKAESLLVPTVNGQINVLPEHTHIIAQLDTGVLTLLNQGKSENFTMTTGVFKVINNKITVLSNVTEKAEDINQERAQKALNKAEEILKDGTLESENDYVKYQRKLARARMRIELIKSIKKR
jgi:F-type H+-transporting ATPase subunit epsilon